MSTPSPFSAEKVSSERRLPSIRLPRLPAFGLPLFAKELTEQAARKRTYVVRSVYAGLLFTGAALLFHDVLSIGQFSPLAVLGTGRQMFEGLLKLQFAGIYLVMPAVACGVLAEEKENNTLGLLFLTKLGPWSILFEKLVSRLFPMCCFLLMSLPLLAFAYTLGGITVVHLWSGIWMLLVTMLQTATAALLCSAWFRTTFGALLGSYAVVAALVLGPLFLFLAGSLFIEGLSVSAIDRWVWTQASGSWGVLQHRDTVLFPFFAPMQFFDYEWTGSGLRMAIAPRRSGLAVVLASLPMVLSAATCLVLSRLCLVRRAFANPRGELQALFLRLDGIFSQWNENRFTRGIVLIRDKSTLPDDAPVAWRETSKRSLGRARYLIRIVVAIEAGFWTLLIMVAVFTGGQSAEFTHLISFLLWLAGVLIVTVQSATLIAGERSAQTLDVLCATPLAGRAILSQKFTSVRRLIAVLWIPFLTLIGVQIGSRVSPLCSLLTVAIYVPLAAWLALWIGMRARTRSRAIILSLAAIAGWCILPVVFVYLPLTLLSSDFRKFPLSLSGLLSPAMIVGVNEYGALQDFGGTSAIVLNSLWYGSLLLFVRRACLQNADRLLGRAESESA